MQPPLELRRIDSLMRRHFITVAPDDAVADVLRLMAFARVRFLPVVRSGVLVGLVSYRTLALSRLQNARDHETALIADLMEQPQGTVAAKAPTKAAAHELWENGRGCVPVVESSDGELRIVGLVTENDLLEAAYRGWTARSGPTDPPSH